MHKLDSFIKMLHSNRLKGILTNESLILSIIRPENSRFETSIAIPLVRSLHSTATVSWAVLSHEL